MFQNYLSYSALAGTDDKAIAGGFDDCSGDDMKVIYAENSLDLSVAWSVMWRKSLSAIWRKGKSFRSDLSDYETVSCRRDDVLRDSTKVVDVQYSLDLSQKTGQ